MRKTCGKTQEMPSNTNQEKKEKITHEYAWKFYV